MSQKCVSRTCKEGQFQEPPSSTRCCPSVSAPRGAFPAPNPKICMASGGNKSLHQEQGRGMHKLLGKGAVWMDQVMKGNQ